MANNLRVASGIILLALVMMVTTVIAVEPQADLNVTKVVSSPGPYAVNDTVTWVVTVWNNGPDDASDITLTEDISQLSGHGDITVAVDKGTYDDATATWTIPSLANATSAKLTFVTNFSMPGEKVNRISITSPPEENSATSTVDIFDKLLLSADLKIKPTTLNIDSKGVFTVFVTLNVQKSPDNEAAKPRIDFDSSTLTCSEAVLIRATTSNKGGGTVMAKFYREDLRNVTNGTGVMVNCSGTLSVDGESIYVEGGDTIRVIEKKGLDKIFSDVKKFLGIEKDDVDINQTEDGTAATAVTLNPDSYKNKGQERKVTRNSDDQSVRTTNSPAPSDKIRGPKEDTEKNTSKGKDLLKNTDGDTIGKGNSNANGASDESPGKSNGKKTK
jgi:uncharacterized repeat protein (TIGR01451 family)